MTVSSLPDHPGVIAMPPRLFIGALVAGFALELVFPTRLVPIALQLSLGPTLVALGLILAYTAIAQQRRAGTNIETHRPTETIVSDGLYGWSRNPIYIGLVLMYLGFAVLGDSLWMLGLLVPLLIVLHYGVILREEAYLERKFGDTYRAYRARVRRWL